MADEQIIYLSPEEELTTVRERLERAQAQRIILIIPPQTQLRSHVGWRLLRARARELDKDVLVISSDRQIRSVVKAAGFRVAESQESPPAGGTRQGTRPSRSGAGGRTGARLRSAPGKYPPDERGSSTDIRISQSEQPAPRDFIVSDQRPAPQDPESRPQDTSPGPVTHPPSSTFEAAEKQFGPDYDFRVDTSPPAPDAEAEQEIDEHDSLVEDYKVAQSIRQAAQLDDAETVTKPAEADDEVTAPADRSSQPHDDIVGEFKDEAPGHYLPPRQDPYPPERASYQGGSYPQGPTHPPRSPLAPTGKTPFRQQHPDTVPSTRNASDPFSLMEDRQSVRLPEQRGAASIDEFDAGVPDISEYQTDVIVDGEIEDLGDEGDIVQPSPLPKLLDEEGETEEVESPRTYGMRPRNIRQDILPKEAESEDALPPIQEPPHAPVRPSALPIPAASAGYHSPTVQPPASPRPGILPSGTTPPGRGMPATSIPARTTRRAGTGVGTNRPPTTAQPRRRTVARRSIGSIILIPAIVLILLLIAALAYFVPSADVTVTLPAQNFSTPLALTATASSQQDVTLRTVRAQTVAFDASLPKTGPATGSKQVGTTPATGQVVFTNHGSQSVHIPTGTKLATNSGVQFMTTSDVLVLTVGSNVGNTIVDLVEAQSLGASGNVPADSITVIPPDSLKTLEQVNGNAALNVSVTNPDPITNGGLGNATAVTQSDIQTLKAALDQQLQQQAKAWLARQVQNGDVQGQPVQMETSAATPAAGQITTSGTVTEQVSLHMTVLIVRAADLRAVAQVLFNAAANKYKANYTLAPQQTLSLTRTSSKSCTPSTGATSLTLCYSASGPIAPYIPVQQVQGALAGKTVKDAMDYLNSIIGGVTTAPVITIHPSFFPWLPFLSPHISIHMKVVPVPTAAKK